MVLDLLTMLGKWNWLVLAGMFFVIELIAPGAFMLWLGLSALLVGIISLFLDWAWQFQLVAFAIFALISRSTSCSVATSCGVEFVGMFPPVGLKKSCPAPN